MSPRVYPRKFDWERARWLHGKGLSYAEIAERLGVSDTAVYLVCNDEARARSERRKSEWQRAGVCPECGAQATRTGSRQNRCRACGRKAKATSVREDTLRCYSCREWKPDEDFPRDAGARVLRRGRHKQCRPCNTKARREYRQRNPEKEAAKNTAYRRAYRARQRAKLL